MSEQQIKRIKAYQSISTQSKAYQSVSKRINPDFKAYQSVSKRIGRPFQRWCVMSRVFDCFAENCHVHPKLHVFCKIMPEPTISMKMLPCYSEQQNSCRNMQSRPKRSIMQRIHTKCTSLPGNAQNHSKPGQLANMWSKSSFFDRFAGLTTSRAIIDKVSPLST